MHLLQVEKHSFPERQTMTISSTNLCRRQPLLSSSPRFVCPNTPELLTLDFGKRPSPGMTTLLSVCKHYQSLLSEHQKASKSRHLSSEEVTRVIKEGYDSIQITPSSPQVAASFEGVAGRYKEAEFRGILKKIWRISIADGTVLLDREDGGSNGI